MSRFRRLKWFLIPAILVAACAGVWIYASARRPIPEWRNGTVEIASFKGVASKMSYNGRYIAAQDEDSRSLLSRNPGDWVHVGGSPGARNAWITHIEEDGTAYGLLYGFSPPRSSFFTILPSDASCKVVHTKDTLVIDSASNGKIKLVQTGVDMRALHIRHEDTLKLVPLTSPGQVGGFGLSLSRDGKVAMARLATATPDSRVAVWRNGKPRIYEGGPGSLPTCMSPSGSFFVMVNPTGFRIIGEKGEKRVLIDEEPRPTLGKQMADFWSRLTGGAPTAASKAKFASGQIAFVSDDGKMMIGHRFFAGTAVTEAMIWTEGGGWRTMDEELETAGVKLPTGYKVSQINGVSDDMRTLIGSASKGADNYPLVIRFRSD